MDNGNLGYFMVRNNFHRTMKKIRCKYTEDDRGVITLHPTKNQIIRTKRVLCPMKDCTCSDAMGCRGIQDAPEGKYVINDLDAYWS